MRNVKTEPLPLAAELVNEAGQPVAAGLLTLSPTPNELEFRSSELPYFKGGEPIGFIVYTGDHNILVSFVGHVGFYGAGLIGICMIDDEPMEKLSEILAQNIAIKTFASYKAGMFSRREDFDISITRVGVSKWTFTTIEDIKIGMELNVDIVDVLKIKGCRLKVVEMYTLRNKVALCIATPQKLSQGNRAELEFYLR